MRAVRKQHGHPVDLVLRSELPSQSHSCQTKMFGPSHDRLGEGDDVVSSLDCDADKFEIERNSSEPRRSSFRVSSQN